MREINKAKKTTVGSPLPKPPDKHIGPHCGEADVVHAKRFVTTFDVCDGDINRLGLEQYEEVESAAVWVYIEVCRVCNTIFRAWVEEVEQEGVDVG